MNVQVHEQANSRVAVIRDVALNNAQDALDLIATIRYEHQCGKLVVFQADLPGEFFQLSSGLAGEILQKFTNYGASLAIVGELETGSNSLRDFIRESNRAGRFLFLADEESAVELLHRLP